MVRITDKGNERSGMSASSPEAASSFMSWSNTMGKAATKAIPAQRSKIPR